MGRDTWRRFGDYLRRPPEVVVQWNDRETDARGWLIVNSFRGGAAGGGTRMRAGLGAAEVVYLAKAMELKFALAGPPIGGAKSGIDFDPHDPRKAEVLERWWGAIAPYLRSRYGTGGDLNVDEVADVLPAFRRLGLRHPQEGIVRGHLDPAPGQFERIIGQLDFGVKAPVEGVLGLEGAALTVADLITGYGVARSVERYYATRGDGLEGVRVLLEGFGNVGAACGLYLARAGARLVAISDAQQALHDPDGVDAVGVEALIRASRDKLLPAGDARVQPTPRDEDPLAGTDAEVFIAAALSGSLDGPRLARLKQAGVDVIAAGANNPIHEQALGSTDVEREADGEFTILADVLANCGMARTFSYLMEDDGRTEATAIFEAVDRTIGDTLAEVLERAGGGETGLLAATLDLTLDRIGAP